MKAAIKRFVVHTHESPNQFMVYVSDLDRVLDTWKKPPSKEETIEISLKRALFIEEALQAAIDKAEE